MQNTFAPISRIPPDVLSLIPDYWERLRDRDWRDADRDVVSLTHVCRGWREIFTSRSSLWTHLDCKNSDKTHAYIERSRSLPLEVSAVQSDRTYSNDILLGLAPHTNRFGSLSIYLPSQTLQDGVLDHFTSPAPLLKKLKIVLGRKYSHSNASILSTIFPEHLSPLRDLSLSGVATHLPWRNLSNLTTFRFTHPQVPVHPLFMRQLLDFFESTPLIRKIVLCDSIPDSPTVLHGRVVPLINLENLTVDPLPAHSPFLDHLSIPTGASLDLDFLWPPGPRIPVCFSNAFHNLRHITTISLFLDVLEVSDMRLSGPSGELRTTGYPEISQIFHSLRKLDLSKTQIMSVTMPPDGTLEDLENSTIPRFLLPLCNLRTLTLTRVDNLIPFIQALNPKQNESCTVLCPELKELVLYIEELDWYYVEELKEMLLERNRRHSDLSSITIVGLGEAYARSEVMSLGRYVSHLTYKTQESAPECEDVFGGTGGWDNDREWDLSPDPFELLAG